jgi:hypothetical protein
MRARTVVGLIACCVGCGSGKQAAAPNGGGDTASSSSSSSATSASASASASGGPAASATATDDEDEVSPGSKAAAAAATTSAPSSGAPIALENLLSKPPPEDFPAKKNDDATCAGTASLSGQNDKDYASLTDKCGSGAGMKPFVTKVSGKLDDKHLRDTYDFKMLGGFCYRFFAVADSGISNIDIRVQKPGGALVSIDSTKGPIAVMDPDRPWCKTHDREFNLVVETTGGKGGYTFGIWARPK